MEDLYYKSTRGQDEKTTASQAIVKGIADDGGLYIPNKFPHIDQPLQKLMDMDYKELAFYIMKKYLGDFEDEELIESISKAYDEKFSTTEIAPLIEKKNVYFLELYHGATLAFKDMALSILPHLIKKASEKLNLMKEVVILTATSGDTGKAALEGFANIEGTKIIVFYPEKGVSDIQKRQMITQQGDNTYVIGIEGNFDDAQKGVKEIFSDKVLNEKVNQNHYMFSSANSINIGRLIPQVVYYFSAYLSLLKKGRIKEGEKINVVVPTGNFGNILAAYYAKQMGLPVHRLICASNENNVLYDFLQTGMYDRRRDLVMTNSPSMDILVSSNLERLLYELSGHDEALIREMMNQLNAKGRYEVTDQIKDGLKDFYGGFALEEDTYKYIKKVYQDTQYVMDPHTAVAFAVYDQYKKETGDPTKTVIASTASPFKFTRSIYRAIWGDGDEYSDFELIGEISKLAGLPIPESIKNIDEKEILHRDVCEKDEMKTMVCKILKV